MSMRLVCLSMVVVGGLGCDRSKPKPPPAAQPTPVAIFIDDRQVATSAALSSAPHALVELAPGAPDPATWLAVIAIDAYGKASTVLDPSHNQVDRAAALIADAGGVTFGFANGDQLIDPVAHVTKVIIKTKDDRGAIAAEVAAAGGHHGGGDSDGNRHDGDGARPTPTADLVIAIKTAKGESTLTGDKLIALPTIAAPVGDTQTPGWSLLDVFTAAGIDHPKIVNLTDSEGASLRLEVADFDPATTILYIKLNRGGQIRFRRYSKKGSAWEMTGDLRGLSKIAVLE